MTGRVEIVPALLGPLSYIMANLREQDRAEIMCQMPIGVQTWKLAQWLLETSNFAWIAKLDGNPEAAFGFSPINVVYNWAWAFGTTKFERCCPAISRYLIEDGIPAALEAGMIGAEARSLLSNESAHRWMEGLGGKRCGFPYPYGRAGEHFVTYRWTVMGYHDTAERHQARRTNVL